MNEQEWLLNSYNLSMARFNKAPKKYTKTFEWAKAKILAPEVELVKLCLTSFMQNTFYETAEETIDRIITYYDNIKDKDFVLKLAIFSRDYGLRSINHLLTALYVAKQRGADGIRDTLSRFLHSMVKRPDEYAEILWALKYLNDDKFVMPNSLAIAIKEDLESWKFDEYKLAKYRNKGDKKLHDIINMVHAKWAHIDKLMKWELQSAETREKKLSAGEDKKSTFAELMAEGKLGAKAFLMNIRNMIEAGVDQKVMADYVVWMNMKGIFPFEIMRGIRASKEHRITPELTNVLMEKAADWFRNLPLGNPWDVAVLADFSGSMSCQALSEKSGLTCKDMWAFYTALCAYNGWHAYVRANSTKKVDVLPWDWPLRIFASMRSIYVWGGTEVQQAVDVVKNTAKKAIIFTDWQFADWIRDIGQLEQVIVFNLNSYANTVAFKHSWKVVEINWYSDIMYKLCWDIAHADKLVERINWIRF